MRARGVPVRDSPRGAAGMPLPTPRALLALAGAVILLVLSGSTTSYALAAGAAALLAGVACGLGSILATAALHARTRWDDGTQGRVAVPLRRLARLLLPTPRTVRTTLERIDQQGRVRASFQLAGEVNGRGLYRCRGELLELRDCFGFWKMRLTGAPGSEVCIPPRPLDAAEGPVTLDAAGSTPPLRESELDTALVRPYERGDSLRAISWRQSAHHGQLMSFESKPAGTVRTLVMVDTLVPGCDDALAAQVASTFSLLAEAGERPLVTDGIATAAEPLTVQRFAAAFTNDIGKTGATRERAAAELVAGAKRIAAGGSALGRVIVITLEPEGTFAREARRAFPGGTVAVIGVKRAPDEARTWETGAEPSGAPASAPLFADIVSTACCLASLAATLSVAATLIAPATWLPFTAASCALATMAAVLARRLPVLRGHAALRTIVTAALLIGIVIVGCVRATELMGATATDLANSIARWPADALAGEDIAGPIPFLASTLVSGLGQLIVGQWVPVTVAPAGDAALTLIAALASCILCAWLVFRRLRPSLALLPLCLLAARLVLMGSSDRAPWMPAILLCLLVSISLIDARRRWALRTVPLAMLATALACASAPQAAVLARNIPFQLDIGPDAFSTTVSPLMDLSEDLRSPRTVTALMYSADSGEPRYLRLATLGDFDGDTWRFDSGADGASSGQGIFGWLMPESAESSPETVAVNGLGLGTPELTPLAIVSPWEQRDIGAAEWDTAHIGIRSLTSPSLPLPIGSTMVDSVSGGVGETDWQWDADGTVRGTDSVTRPRMSYRAQGHYLAPLTASKQVDKLEDLPEQLEAAFRDAAGTQGALITARGNKVDLDSLRTLDAGDTYRTVPDGLPTSVRSVVDAARSQGVPVDRALSGGASYEDELDIVRWLLDYFARGGFAYSLDAPDGNGAGNLEVIGDFLERKQGYCVHYASALTVLCRLMGLPARVAMGYRAGGNALTDDGRYQVTNRDLHAWTEVYLDGVGWVPLDATPAGVAAGDEATGGRGDGTNAPGTREEPGTTDEEREAEAADRENDGGRNVEGEGAPSETDEDPADDALQRAATLLADAGKALGRIAPHAAGILGAAVVLLGPQAIRRHRTRARLAAIRAGGSDSVPAAWAELTDTALDAGIAWPASATEEDIARQIARVIASAQAGAPPNMGNAVDDAARSGKPAEAETGRKAAGHGMGGAEFADKIDLLASAVCERRYGPGCGPACNRTALGQVTGGSHEATPTDGAPMDADELERICRLLRMRARRPEPARMRPETLLVRFTHALRRPLSNLLRALFPRSLSPRRRA